MSGLGRRWSGALLGVVVVIGIAAGSRVPYPAAEADRAVLRLSWRTLGERVEECRTLTNEELAELPVHMRRTEVCEGRVLPYDLVVELDGEPVVRQTIQPAGARADRPLYVHRELELEPGRRRLSVRFLQTGAADPGTPAGATHSRQQAGGPTPPLGLDRQVELRAGEVLLVTYVADRRSLVVRQPEPRR